MPLLIQWCDLGWWVILLSWLLPFFTGWLISRMILQREAGESSEKTAPTAFPAGQRPVQHKESDWHALIQQKIDMETELADCRRQNLVWQRKVAELELKMEAFRHSVAPPSAMPSSETTVVSTSGVTAAAAPAVSASANPVQTDDLTALFSRLPKDKLQIFEGIGPKMETFLRSLKISDWSLLAAQDPSFLKARLEALDPKYRILEPESWPRQATLACEGQWQELIRYQKELSAGKSREDTVITDAKIEKIMYKMGLLKKYQKDDLVAIEGIGPKIAAILRQEGIGSWDVLAQTSPERLQSIIQKAGDRFQLADPGTWPRQAALARDGRWKELYDYQDTLKGGKEI